MRDHPTTTPDEFRRARAIFESALDWPPADRAQRIEQACGGDQSLAVLVEDMLRADAAPHRLLDAPPGTPADRWQPGDVFARRYRIDGLIGRGGMGEVYRAHDAELGRDVALKVLPPDVALGLDGPDRLARFRREAQVLASLNHPNIAAIHGVEEAGGVRALILELVDGPTLADRIAAGPIPIDDAVAVARQITVGLEIAHEQGVVHRDLKPANVKLRTDGTVKLLDFGLAKVVQPEAALASGASTNSPTVTSPSMIARGVLLGTAAYMSPEQAKGREADRRSDIWAFGAVLYEMLTGTRAFKGGDIPETLAAVLRAEIDWGRLPAATPAPLRQLLRRCLDRDLTRRLRDIGEARIALDDLAADRTEPGAPGGRETIGRLSRIAVPACAALAAGVAIGAWTWRTPLPAAPQTVRFILDAPADRQLRVDSQSRDLTITPDGRQVIYKGGPSLDRTQLFVYALDQLNPEPLIPPGQPKAPFPSPDGQWIGYFEPGPPGAALKKVALTGGPAIDVSRLDGPSRGATWGADNSIVAASGEPTTGLLRIPAAGGAFEVLTRPSRDRGEADHLWPQFLPGGRSILFTITSLSGGIDAAQVAVLDLATKSWRPILPAASQAQYLASGHLVYLAGGALWAVAFDAERLEPVGSARVVLPQVATLGTGVAEFDVSPDGTLVYVASGGFSASRTLIWVDRQGREQPIAAPPRPYASVRLSPDGTRVAVEIEDRDDDIWVWDLQRETLSRVTQDPGRDESPVWTRDGKRLAFSSEAGGVMGAVFWRPADGSGQIEQLTDGRRISRPSSVTPDGRHMIVSDAGSMAMLALDGSGQTQLFATPVRARGDGVVSPDGRWLAYVEITGSSPNVFVSPLAAPDQSRVPISAAGGAQPRWSPDGRELFYLGLDGLLMRVDVTPGEAFGAGRPERVLDQARFRGLGMSQVGTYDVAPDGRRFLMVKDATTAEPQARITVVRHWGEELKRLVPVPAR